MELTEKQKNDLNFYIVKTVENITPDILTGKISIINSLNKIEENSHQLFIETFLKEKDKYINDKYEEHRIGVSLGERLNNLLLSLNQLYASNENYNF